MFKKVLEFDYKNRYDCRGVCAIIVPNEIYTLGFDAKRTGSNTRVSSVLRLIEENRIEDAIIKIRNSKRINAQHPEAFNLANDILKRRF